MNHINSNSNCGEFGIKRPAISEFNHRVPSSAELKAAQSRSIRNNFVIAISWATKRVAGAVIIISLVVAPSVFLKGCADDVERQAVHADGKHYAETKAPDAVS